LSPGDSILDLKNLAIRTAKLKALSGNKGYDVLLDEK
jgi:hypothetical protein